MESISNKTYLALAITSLLLAAGLPLDAGAHGGPEYMPDHNANVYAHSYGQSDEYSVGQEFKREGNGQKHLLSQVYFWGSVEQHSSSWDICIRITDINDVTLGRVCRDTADDNSVNVLETHSNWDPATGNPASIPFTSSEYVSIDRGEKYKIWIEYTRDCSGSSPSCALRLRYLTADGYRFGEGLDRATISNGGSIVRHNAQDMALSYKFAGHSPETQTDGHTGMSVQSNGVQVTLQGTDIDSGMSGTSHYFKWGTTSSYGNTESVSCSEGTTCSTTLQGLRQATTYHFTFCGSNDAGEQCGSDRQFTTPDPVPSTPTLSGPSYATTTAPADFTASASDPGDNLQIGYDWDNDGAVDRWKNFVDSEVTDTESHTFSSDGTYDVRAIARDQSGNNNSPFSSPLSVVVDSVAPQDPAISSSTHPDPDAWVTNNDPSFVWTQSDALSGVDGSRYRLDNGAWSSIENQESQGYTDVSEGTHVFEVEVYDRSGNVAADSHGFKVDTIAPSKAAPRVVSGTLGENSWYTTSVDLDIDSEDATSGVDCEYHATSSTGPWSPSGCVTDHSWTVSNEGTNTYWGRAVDHAGLERSGQDSLHLKVDRTDPTVTDNQADIPWTDDVPPLNVDFGDTTSGIWMIEYEVWSQSGQSGVRLKDWTTVFSTTSDGVGSYTQNWDVDPTALQEGDNYVSVRVTDRAGREVVVPDVTRIQLDSVAPTDATPSVTSGQQGNNDWYTTNVGLEIVSNDATSGVASEWHTDVGVQGPWSGGAQHDTWTDTTEGTQTWWGRAIDQADLEYISSGVPIKIDKSVPDSDVTLSGTSGSNGWFTSDVSATISASDSVSGMDELNYRVEGDAWQTAPGNSVLVDGFPEGVTDLYHYAVDNAGNADGSQSNPITTPIKIDKVAPSSSHTIEGTIGDDNWYVTTVRVVIDASDATSGIDQLWYQVNDGGWSDAGATSHEVFLTNVGTHTIEYYAVDKAGHSDGSQLNPRSVTIKVDHVAPDTVPDVSATTGSNGWYTSEPTVTLGRTDQTGGSGVAETRYGLNVAGTPSVYTGPITISGEGIHELNYKSLDHAGNEEVEATETIKVDTVAPNIGAFDQAPADLDAGFLGDVTVDVSVNPGASGVDYAEYRYSTNTGDTWTAWTDMTPLGGDDYTFVITEPQLGWWSVKNEELHYQVRVADVAGHETTTDVVCSGTLVGCDPIQRVAPSVTLLNPVDKAEWGGGTRIIEWRAQDRDHDTVTYKVFLSADSGASFFLLLDTQTVTEDGGLNTYQYAFDTTTVDDGYEYVVKVTANDGLFSVNDQNWETFIIDNTPPEVELERPKQGHACTARTCVPDPTGRSTVSGTMFVMATAQDFGAAPTGVDFIEFQIDGGIWHMGTEIRAGFSEYEWDTTDKIGETVVVCARSTDDAGNVVVQDDCLPVEVTV